MQDGRLDNEGQEEEISVAAAALANDAISAPRRHDQSGERLA